MAKIIDKISFPPRGMLFLSMVMGGALWTAPAQAYIDPGSGSMFLQLLVAAVAGGLWTLKVYWRRLKSFFTSAKPSDGQGDETPAKKN